MASMYASSLNLSLTGHQCIDLDQGHQNFDRQYNMDLHSARQQDIRDKVYPIPSKTDPCLRPRHFTSGYVLHLRLLTNLTLPASTLHELCVIDAQSPVDRFIQAGY